MLNDMDGLMNFPDDAYNVLVMDYVPEFMKIFYNNIEFDKIKMMEINFDFNWNTVVWNSIQGDAKKIFIRSKESAGHYAEDDCIVLEIEDYI